MKSRAVIFIFAIISVFVYFNMERWKENMYMYDADGYYMYLPAMFIYHDIGQMGFNKKVHDEYGVSEDTYYVFAQPTGKKTNMYAVGTAMFELPAFMAAYGWSDHVEGYRPDGYDTPFQLAGFFSGLIWVVFGLFILARFLRVYFSDTVTAIVMACIAFGTNLYTYVIFNPGMSHVYVFFISACILYYTQRWYARHNPTSVYMLGLMAAMALITRPVAIIILLITFLWEVNSVEKLRERLLFFKTQARNIAIATCIFFIVALVQMSYWKYTSGHWIFFSYQNDGFDFLHSKIWAGLFGYRKGWFVYTPVALVGMVGLYFMRYRLHSLMLSVTLYFIIIIYVVFSWRNWWYGGGFSCRAMIDSLPVLALPLGALTEWVMQKGRVVMAGLLLFFSACITLNCFQSYQYAVYVLHSDRMSKAFYWKIFGKTKINNAELDQYLMSEHDYNEEIKKRFNRK